MCGPPATSVKRILLTAEILGDMRYEDPDVLDLSFPSVARLRSSSNPVNNASVFEGGSYEEPGGVGCLQECWRSAGGSTIAQETREEARKCWAVGPLAEIPTPIDDFSISDINGTASSHNKVDLHIVDIFPAVARNFSKGAMMKQKQAHWLQRRATSKVRIAGSYP